MMLSSSMISNALAGKYIYNIYGKLSDTFALDRPVLISGSADLPSSRVLIGSIKNIKKLPHKKIHSMLLTRDAVSEDLFELFDCVLLFTEKIDLNVISNEIHALYDIYDSWLHDIAELTRQNCSLDALLDRSQPIFENPLIVHDSNFHYIAYSSIIDTSGVLSFLVDPKQSDEITNNFLIDREYHDTFSVKEAAFFSAHLTGIRTIYKNIFVHDNLLCRILVTETSRNFRNTDLPLLEILSDYVQFLLTREQPFAEAPVNTLASLLHQLLSEAPLEEYDIQRTLSHYGWRAECTYFCINLYVDYIDVQNCSSGVMQEWLERNVPGSCVLEFKNNIVVFVNTNISRKKADDVIHDITPFIRDHNLKAGISRCHHGSWQIFRQLYTQADLAHDIGFRYAPFKWLHRFNEIADTYTLECCIRELPADMVCSPEIVEIHEHDRLKNTEYFHTLKTYLNNNMQSIATAKKLFIHRTTLLYRLEKMQELFHLDLNNPEKRVMYQFSIMLLEQTASNLM